MSEDTAGIFVKKLKDRIDKEKKLTLRKRLLLQESLNLILELFSADSSLEIRSIRDFETNEVSCFVDLYSPNDLLESLSASLESSEIDFKKEILNDYKFLIIFDLGSRLITSGRKINLFYFEVVSKRLRTFKIKISPIGPIFFYSIFEKNYHEVKYWIYDDGGILISSIVLNNLNRSKKRHKILDQSGKYLVTIELDLLGSVKDLKIKRKGEEKNQQI